MKRREFLRNATFVASVPLAAASLVGQVDEPAGGPSDRTAADRPAGAEPIPMRELGRTGVRVSMLGLGGFHIGGQRDPAESIRIIRAAIDAGITFMDNSWDYHGGESELRMGRALRDGYRDRVFLMTKFDGRTRQAASRQIDESLKRLQTDHLDLVQFHENIRLEDPDRFFAPGGAVEAVTAARDAGKTRFVGFTGHKDPFVHLRMLEMARELGFRFDTVQMPLNVMDAHFRSFGRHVLPTLVREQIGVLAMKPMGSGEILKSRIVSPIECLQYALNLPTSVVITGIDSIAVLEQALDAARTFKPFSEDQLTALLERTAEAAGHGRFEPFKTTDHFDSTAHNPQWLG